MNLSSICLAGIILAVGAQAECEWINSWTRQGHLHISAQLDRSGCHEQTPLAVQLENASALPDDIIVAAKWQLVVYAPDMATGTLQAVAHSSHVTETVIGPSHDVTWCYPLPPLPSDEDRSALMFVVARKEAVFAGREY